MTVLEYSIVALVIASLVIGLVVLLSITGVIRFPEQRYNKALYSSLILCILLLVLCLFSKALIMYNQNNSGTDECAKADPPFWCNLETETI